MKIKTILFIIGFLPLVFFSGCYTWYHEKTIGKKEIEKDLVDPDLKQIVIATAKVKHPDLKPVIIDIGNGISPDEAAVIALYSNPSLKVRRTKLGIAEAQLTQSGILPNPVFSYTFDSPVGGTTLGSFNAYGFGLSWDITSLVSILPKVKSKEFNRDSVELNIAWQEFLTAQNSKIEVYKNIILSEQIKLLKAWEKEVNDKIIYIRQGLKIGVTTELTLSTVKNMKNDIHTTLLKKQKEKQTQFLAFASSDNYKFLE